MASLITFTDFKNSTWNSGQLLLCTGTAFAATLLVDKVIRLVFDPKNTSKGRASDLREYFFQLTACATGSAVSYKLTPYVALVPLSNLKTTQVAVAQLVAGFLITGLFVQLKVPSTPAARMFCLLPFQAAFQTGLTATVNPFMAISATSHLTYLGKD